VDTLGRAYLLLDDAKNRGSNASTEFIRIFSVERQLRDRGAVVISQGILPDGRWTYAYRVSTPPGGGLVIRLKLHVDPGGWKPKEIVPRQVHRTLVVDVDRSLPGERIFTRNKAVVEPDHHP
jgi:hypothetical protein